jgi:amino acid permease
LFWRSMNRWLDTSVFHELWYTAWYALNYKLIFLSCFASLSSSQKLSALVLVGFLITHKVKYLCCILAPDQELWNH